MNYRWMILVCLLIIAGCGGGGGRDPLNVSGYADLTMSDGVNQDDSLYDSQSFSTTRDGWVQVTMSSSTLDSYLIVYRGVTEDVEVGYDDDSGTKGNAVYFFHAGRGETYTAKFTTNGEGTHTGDYTFSIKEVTGPDTTRTLALTAGKQPHDPAMKRTK